MPVMTEKLLTSCEQENPASCYQLERRLPEHDKLEAMLLALGGKRVVLQREPHLDIIIERGRVFEANVKKVRGLRNNCHTNSALYYVCTFGE